MATKNFYIGPQDGWVKVLSTGAAHSVRISAYPHTQPFYVYGDPSTVPSSETRGISVCHHPFKVMNSTDEGNTDAFYVRVPNPCGDAEAADGRLRLDVYTDGGTLN